MKRFSNVVKKLLYIFLALGLFACRLAIMGIEQPVEKLPTPTFTKFVTRTFTPTASSTPTSTLVPSATPTFTSTPTAQFMVAADTPIPEGLPAIRVENAAFVSALAEWLEPSVSDLAWTPDGRLLAVATTTRIDLYQIDTRSVLRTLYPTSDGIVKINFSPGGTWLVSGSRRGDEKTGYASSLDLWLGPNWKPLGLIYGVEAGLSDMTFTPEGDYLAVVYSRPAYNASYVDFWSTLTWTINTTMDAGNLLEVAVSPDGSYLATSPDRYAVQVWDLEEHIYLYKLPTSFTGAVNTMVFSPDSGILATGHYDGIIRLWDVENGDLLLEFDTGAVVQSLAFSPDGLIIASGGSFENSDIQLWDVGSGARLKLLENDSSGIGNLVFSPDSLYLVSASYDGVLRLWGIRP
jgi:WD40 repeat protein